MKKLILFVVSASFLVASAAYASTTVIINNQMTTNNPSDIIYLDGHFRMQVTKSSFWSSSFYNLPKGKNVISTQWPAAFLKAKIDDITGSDSDVDHDFVPASPSCKHIKITPDATNRIDLTSGTISPFGSKMLATICKVSYSEQK